MEEVAVILFPDDMKDTLIKRINKQFFNGTFPEEVSNIEISPCNFQLAEQVILYGVYCQGKET